MISLLVMTDGRKECIKRSIPSAIASLNGPITHRIIHDDSGDPEYKQFLKDNFPTFDIIGQNSRQGFGGAIKYAWETLRCYYPNTFVFSTEDDFLFNESIDLYHLMDILIKNPHLAQIALKRQPWNAQEIAAGGIVEQHPQDYEDKESWLEHRRFFTTNSSLYTYELINRGWPNIPNSEGMFSIELFKDPSVKSAFYGKRFDPPKINHIGDQRIGTGY